MDKERLYDIVVAPRDPIIARDGRPFAATPGAQAVSLPWPLPGTLAGTIRTAIGTSLGFDWRNGGAGRARRIAVLGPLMLARRPGAETEEGWSVYLSAPRDAVVVEAEPGRPEVHALRPYALPAGAGVNLPDGLCTLHRSGPPGKPSAEYLYWPLTEYISWLATTPPPGRRPPPSCPGALPRDTRVHVAIDHQTATALEGALFSTEALAFADAPLKPWPGYGAGEMPARALLCRVATDEAWTIDRPLFATLGGERRLVELRPATASSLWPSCPDELSGALEGQRRLRLILATPALFTDGWKPGWLGDGLTGSPPGASDLRLRLVAAAVSRPEPVSGWDMERNAPKTVRYMAPAGSVYFFEVTDGTMNVRDVAALWFASLSDAAQDRNDGFGLALPGVW